MKKDIILEKLLCYGFFPERLDGIFTSELFGKWIIANNAKINTPKNNRFSLLSYKLTRNNNSPRHMGIPHPLGFFRVCKEIFDNWEKIKAKINNTSSEEKSMIRPKLNNKNKRLVSLASYDLHPHKEQIELDKQFGKKYFVNADISTCYPSIYTHSISWALVGKGKAKKNQTKEKVWYNRLDKACRNIQDGETIGIPIGPDTSGLVSELILSQIDRKLKKYDYLRFIDDYKCFCTTKEEAESFIRDLSHSLEEYRLKLNTKKTKILPLPKALNDDWVRRLRQFVEWKEIDNFNKNKVIGFLDLSSELFRENPSGSPIRYAAQVLKKKIYKEYTTYKLILRYFLNLCFLYPYVIDICDDLISLGIKTFPIQADEIKEILKKSLHKILKEHVEYRRSDVITWSLFLAIKYNLVLDEIDKFSNQILKTNDCIPILMCYLYREINKKDNTKFTNLLDKVNENEWWLYVYEVSRIGKRKLLNSEMEKFRNKKITFLSDEIISRL